jgi:Arc/MetJ family transcription regulator
MLRYMRGCAMVKRTTINLDAELVSQAREVLETANTTDTVHGALREIVRRDRLRRLAEREWGMTLEELEEMRRSRVETRPWSRLDADFSDIRPPTTPSASGPALEDGAEDKPKRAA